MEAEEPIVNRVASSPLVTFDLEEYYTPGERVVIDISNQLYQGLVLREKDFRDYVRTTDWSSYAGKYVAITCYADAIVPTWAYMLLVTALEPFSSKVVFGDADDLEASLFLDRLSAVEWEKFRDAKVVVKGCSKHNVPVALYVEVTRRLRPFVASLMFGEPCSTVPLYKKAKK